MSGATESEADRVGRRFAPRPNRQKEGVAAKRLRAELIAACGGDPPVNVRVKIERAVHTKRVLDGMDRDLERNNFDVSFGQSRNYAWFNNSLLRYLKDVEQHFVTEKSAPKTLAERIAEKDRARAVGGPSNPIPRPIPAAPASVASRSTEEG